VADRAVADRDEADKMDSRQQVAVSRISACRATEHPRQTAE
jgi:hypothetical protein